MQRPPIASFSLLLVWIPVIGWLLSASASAQAQNSSTAPATSPPPIRWTQWRGPRRDGHVPPALTSKTWPEKLATVWQHEVGAGHCSPVVGGGLVFTLTRRDDKEYVTALDLTTGEKRWDASESVKIGINPYAKGHGRWPRATPLLDGDRLITLGADATMHAWDAATGKPLWRLPHKGSVDTSQLFCGTSVSPLLHRGQVLAHLGDDSAGELIAVDAKSGAVTWRHALEGPGYASPVIAEIDGVDQLITLTKSRVIAASLTDGHVLWSVPFDDKWNENILTPIVSDGLVFVSGVRRGSMALRPTLTIAANEPSEWNVEVVWADRGTALYMSSPILRDGVLYGFSRKRRGTFIAIDLTNGKTLWTERERAENAALLWAGSHLLALTTESEFLVTTVNRDGIRIKHRYRVAETPAWAHPIPLPDGLLVKDAHSIKRLRHVPTAPTEKK